MIVHSENSGRTWAKQDTNTSDLLNSVFFINASTGWAVGLGGTILATTDGGKTWTKQNTNTTEYLFSVSFVNASTGWATGRGGRILATTDGGKTWDDPVKYHLFPAPWYYLSWLPVIALLAPVLRRPDAVKTAARAEESVADILVSDRPLEAGDFDPLGYKDVAEGLSRFLRNDKTQPPLTIAITGEWGTGKTSLMNLLRADLAFYGFQPVWFNAWHHQQEESLLAALLENVRAQAVPPWWRREGLGFRSRLLKIRSGRYWPLALLLLIGFSFSTGYFIAHPEKVALATAALKRAADTVGKPESDKKEGGKGDEKKKGSEPKSEAPNRPLA